MRCGMYRKASAWFGMLRLARAARLLLSWISAQVKFRSSWKRLDMQTWNIKISKAQSHKQQKWSFGNWFEALFDSRPFFLDIPCRLPRLHNGNTAASNASLTSESTWITWKAESKPIKLNLGLCYSLLHFDRFQEDYYSSNIFQHDSWFREGVVDWNHMREGRNHPPPRGNRAAWDPKHSPFGLPGLHFSPDTNIHWQSAMYTHKLS